MSGLRTIAFADVMALQGGALRESPHLPGILMLELPLSFGPRRVNAWLIEDAGGWSIVDCGADTPEIAQIWRDVLAHVVGKARINRIIVTHGHVDHVGHAGPIWHAIGQPPFLMTRTEYFAANLRALRGLAGSPSSDHTALYRAYGVPESELPLFLAPPAALQLLAPLPGGYRRMNDGDALAIGNRAWQVIAGGGHAPEHAALFCRDDAVLIAGDQVLPRITPFVGVFPDEPEADPLGEFLAALARFSTLPEETIVLPSHGAVFHGLRARTRALRRHHDDRLDKFQELARAPVSAFALAAEVFAPAMATEHRRLALAETLAHLNHLCALGRLDRSADVDGTLLFQAL